MFPLAQFVSIVAVSACGGRGATIGGTNPAWRGDCDVACVWPGMFPSGVEWWRGICGVLHDECFECREDEEKK